MKSIITFFINRPKLVNLIVAFLILVGGLSLSRSQNQGYPPVDFGSVVISTIYPGASPEDVELKVTSKIEDKLKGISGIKRLDSASMESISIVSIQLEDTADFDKVKSDINKAVDQVNDFPVEVKNRPLVEEIDTNRFPVMEVAFTGDASYRTLRQYADAFEQILETHKSIGSVKKVGYLDREVKILADPLKLKSNYVSLTQLSAAINSHNFRLPGGDIKAEEEKKLLVLSEFDHVTDVGDVIIRSGFDGNKIRISDVAVIEDGYVKPEKLAHYNGKRAINLLAIKKESADVVKTAEEVELLVNEFRTTLPDNVQVNVIVDYSDDVHNLLNLVMSNAKVGLLLVLVALVLFLNIKVAIWTALGIPISILTAFIFFGTFGLTVNFISLMAIIIVLGMVVDDAIIVAENIFSYREQGMEAKEAAVKGTLEVLWPVITSVLTTIVAFSPMIAMTGVMGKFMWSMPVVIALILLASLFESIFILPSHIAHSKLSSKVKKESGILKRFERGYTKMVSWTLRHKFSTWALFCAVAGVAVFLMATQIKFILFPSDNGIIGVVRYELPRGTSIEGNMAAVSKIEKVLLTYPKSEITGFVTVGGERMPDVMSYGNNINVPFVGNILVHLTPVDDRTRNAKAIMSDIHNKIKDIKGFARIQADVVEDGPPVGRPVTVTFISDNDTLRMAYVDELREFLNNREGVFNIEDSEGQGKRKLEVTLNYPLISSLGIRPFDVANTIRSAYDGDVATSLRRDGEDIDFRVMLNESSRKSLDTIKSLTVPSNQEKQIPIGQLVRIEEKEDVMVYNHNFGTRATTIYADVDTDILTSAEINKEIAQKFEERVRHEPLLLLEFGGEEQDTQESMQSLFMSLILALVGIYFILVVLFNSFAQPFLVMVAIPYSFVGVILAYYIHDMPLSFPALIGMVGLMGVVVNNSLVMISFLNSAVEKNGFSIETLSEGATRRLRPILLTSATTAAGLFPTAYGFGGDNPVIVPMIMAISWGLIFSTVITLILIPSLYMAQVQFFNFCGNVIKKDK